VVPALTDQDLTAHIVLVLLLVLGLHALVVLHHFDELLHETCVRVLLDALLCGLSLHLLDRSYSSS
jgi:hypothetical protein